MLLVEQLAQIFRKYRLVERPAQLQLPRAGLGSGNADGVALLRRVEGKQSPGAGFNSAVVSNIKSAGGKGQCIPGGVGARGRGDGTQQGVHGRPLPVLDQVQRKGKHGQFGILHAKKFHGFRCSALLQQHRAHGRACFLPMLGIKCNSVAPRNIGIVNLAAVPQFPAVVAHEVGLLLLRSLCPAESQAGNDKPYVVLRVDGAYVIHMVNHGLPGLLHLVPVFVLPGKQKFAKIDGNILPAGCQLLLKSFEFGGFARLRHTVVQLPLQIQVVRGHLGGFLQNIAGILDIARCGVGIGGAHSPHLRAGGDSPAFFVHHSSFFLLLHVQIGFSLDGVERFLIKALLCRLPVKVFGLVLLARHLQRPRRHCVK